MVGFLFAEVVTALDRDMTAEQSQTEALRQEPGTGRRRFC
jgi:hypothetical protein